MTDSCPKCGHDPSAVVLASWRLFVPREVKSGNDRVNNVGGSRWEYGANRRAWLSDMNGLRLIHHVPDARFKRRVTLIRRYGKGKRAFDVDNLAAGLKPCVDAMVKARLLVNDNPANAEIHYQQERSEVPGLVVLIEELS